MALPFKCDGFTSSIFFASSDSFAFPRIWVTCSNSDADLITISLFFVGKPVDGLTGLISIAIHSFQVPAFELGSFQKDTLYAGAFSLPIWGSS